MHIGLFCVVARASNIYVALFRYSLDDDEGWMINCVNKGSSNILSRWVFNDVLDSFQMKGIFWKVIIISVSLVIWKQLGTGAVLLVRTCSRNEYSLRTHMLARLTIHLARHRHSSQYCIILLEQYQVQAFIKRFTCMMEPANLCLVALRKLLDFIL